MKRQLFYFFLLICLTFPLSTTAQVVDIPDPNLRVVDIPDPNLRAVLKAAFATFGKALGDPITALDMSGLYTFTTDNPNITDLTGLEAAINLTDLHFWGSNNISDISAVAGLTKLTYLGLRDNNISDISAVAGLTKLTYLRLWGNNISDISAVAGLTKLIYLRLSDNNISDISAVAGLTQLVGLGLRNNNISDISAVAGLTKLTYGWGLGTTTYRTSQRWQD